MNQRDLETMLGLFEEAVAAHNGSVVPGCPCSMCTVVAKMQAELERQNQVCTACGRKRYVHIGVRHLFTRVANAAKPKPGMILP